MNRVANNYWVDERIQTQRVAPRASTAITMASVQQVSIDLIGSKADIRRRGGILPSWVIFAMILLATAAVCVTVNMRTRAKAQLAAVQFSAMESDVQSLRAVNQTLKIEVQKLKTDPRTIELAARSRLNMIRGNEYLVPVE